MLEYLLRLTFPFLIGLILAICAVAFQAIRQSPRYLHSSERGWSVVALSLVPLVTLCFLVESWAYMAFRLDLPQISQALWAVNDKFRLYVPIIAGTLSLVIALFPLPRKPSTPSAEIATRNVQRFIPRQRFMLPAGIITLLLITVLWTGLISEPDSEGKYRSISISFDETYASTFIYGWYYSVPGLMMVGILVTLGFLILLTLSRFPLDESPQAVEIRRARMLVVLAIVSGTLLLHLGYVWHDIGATGTLTMSGGQLRGNVMVTNFAALSVPLGIAGNAAIALGYAAFLTPLLRLLLLRPSRTPSLVRL